MNNDFATKAGLPLNGVNLATINKLRAALQDEYGVTMPQVCEAASYSMAMVVRFALGLSASGGMTCGIVRDCLSGWVVAATLRHLVNAGADAQVILIPEGAHSPNLTLQLKPLEAMGLPIYDWTPSPDQEDLISVIQSCHNTLVGLFDPLLPDWKPDLAPLISVLNEVPTPNHSVELPYGIDPDSGKANSTPLFSSSTLSLGAPLKGLVAGNEYAGRHYVCDISITKALYLSAGQDLCPLFSDQPVVQILKPEVE